MRRLLILCLSLLAALASGATTSKYAQAAEASPPDRAAIEKIVREYILANPEIILEAVRVLRQREAASSEHGQREAIISNRETLINDPEAPVGGNLKGEFTITAFLDYQCPYCKTSIPVLKRLIDEDKTLRIVYKELPVLGPASVTAAQAALAAARQGRYQEVHVALMQVKGALTEDRVLQTAASTGLDMARLRRDMASPEIEAAISRNRALAETLDIHGTPAFVIGTALIPGAVDLATLQSAVANSRNDKKGQ